MAQIWSRPEIKLKIALELNEEEARALEYIASYNIEDLLKILYTHMGERPIDEHKQGIISLFKTVRMPLGKWIRKVDDARKTFETE